MPDLFKDIQRMPSSVGKEIVLPYLNEPLVVNWGKGRLRKFQTKESFYAEFCIINKLTVKECLNFWYTNLNLTKVEIINNDKQIKRLAEILHEEEDVIESVFARENYSRSFFGNHWSILRKNQPDEYRVIRYCPICIQAGYHAYFHDYHAFKICLLHHIALEEEHYRWNCAPSKYHHYINNLSYILLKNATDIIHHKKNTKNDEFIDACNKFDGFIHWTKKVADQTMSMVMVSPKSHFFYYETLQVLFGKLQSLEPSELILDLCKSNFAIRKEEPFVIRFDHQLMRDLNTITDIIPYKEFIQFFLLACLHDEDQHAFAARAQEIITAIKSLHKHCTCYVGWTKQTGWQRFEEPVKGYQDYLCPFHYACMLIENNWLSTDKMNNYFIWDRRFHTSQHYKKAIKNLSEAKWITITDSSKRGFPKINFNWSFQLTFYLEVVVYTSMELFAQSLVSWLNTCVKTKTLQNISFLQPNAYLKKFENSDDVELYVWKTKTN